MVAGSAEYLSWRFDGAGTDGLNARHVICDPNPDKTGQARRAAGSHGVPMMTPPPPPRSHRKKLLWIGGGVVAAIVIVAAAILAVTPNGLNTSSQASGGASPAGAPARSASAPGEPVVCGNDTQLCVPHVDIVRDVVPKLKAAGFTCAPAAPDKVQDCKHGRHQEIAFTNFDASKTDTHVESIRMEADVFAVGSHPPPGESAAAWKMNGKNFREAVGVVFASYPKIERDLLGWLSRQTGACNYRSTSDHDTVDRYQLSCMRATPVAVTGNGLTVTTWSSEISISTPLQ